MRKKYHKIDLKISSLNEEKTMLMTKYQNLIDEMEIANSNVRKFYQTEQQLKTLQEENIKLINQLKVSIHLFQNHRETELLQVKLNELELEIKNSLEKIETVFNQ
jgi:hypothetical protein